MRLKCVVGGLLLMTFLIAGSVASADDKKGQRPDRQGFYSLFNGKDMDDWKASEAPGTFRVQEGQIIVNGPRSHLYYMGPVKNHDFHNFELKVECMTFPKANSGIYFHTEYQDTDWPARGFEVQVNQTHADVKKTGGLYNVKDVLNQSPVNDNEWYTYDITVRDKHVVVKVNGKVTCDWTQPDDWKGPPGMPGRVLSHGTIAIQGHDPGSKILYRSVKIKLLD